MANELKQSQLTRIVVPAITDAEYSTGLADAFEKINDNFKKIASLPFLQGVQGDSYQLEEYPIWKKDTTENWILTEDGKILLDSIFEMDTTKDGNSFNDIRTCIGQIMPEENGVSPIDFFMSEDKNTIVNNSLYFYVIKDDTGNIIEKQLGQYYYFVDGRLKEVGSIYNSENAGSVLSVFNDYTGFYQYKYNTEDTENSNGEYIKVEILPTIYYDQNKNDICWKFNGNETGISAIGIKGSDGKDADLSIVKVDLNNENNEYNNNATSGKVVGILDTSANNGEASQWFEDETYFKTGKALIYMSGKIPKENLEENNINPLTGETETDEITINDFAYGEIVKQNEGYIAYWEPNCVFSKILTNNAFTQYFYNLGSVSYTNNAAYFLAIPSIQDRISSTNDVKQHAHIIKGYEGSKDSNIESLNIFHSDDAFDKGGNQNINAVESGDVKTLNIKNYGVNISKGGAVISSGGIQVTTEKPTAAPGPNNYANVKSNVLKGYNDPGDGAYKYFPDDITNGGYPLVTMSYDGNGIESKDCMVFGNGDICALKWNGTKYEKGELCLQDIYGYYGKTKVGGSFEVARGTASFAGAVTMKSTLGVSGAVNIGGTTKIRSGANSTDTQTGALVVAGGVGIGGDVNIEDTLKVGGSAAIDSYLTVGGTLGVSGAATFMNDVSVGGSLGVEDNLVVGGSATFQEALSVSGAVISSGGIQVTTQKPVVMTGNAIANVNSNVLIGHNNPGNEGLSDFPTDIKKGGYPLVTMSYNKDGSESKNCLVFGNSDIYALNWNKTTNKYEPGELCLQDRIGYFGKTKVGGSFEVARGTASFAGAVTMKSTLGVSGAVNIGGTTKIKSSESSSNIDTGALVVTGGVGIGANLNVGGTLGVTDDAIFYNDLHVEDNLGVGGSASIGSYLTIGGTLGVSGTASFYNDLYILSISESTNETSGALVVDGGVGIGGDVNIAGVTKFTKLSGSTDLEDAALMVDGDARFKSRLRIDGVTKITNVSNSFDVSDGALVVNGGVGIGANLYIGGTTKIKSGASSTSVETGALVVDGGVGIDGDIHLSGSAHIGLLDAEEEIIGKGGIKIKKGGSIYGNSSVQIRGGIGLIVEGGYGGSDANTMVVDGGAGLDVLGGSGTNGGTGIYVKGGKGNIDGGVGIYVEGGFGGNAGAGIVVYGGTNLKNKKGTAIVAFGNINVKDGQINSEKGFFQDSDERLKDFHEDIEVCLDDITKLPKKYFTWKDDDTKTLNIGTSAQEVQKLYPELVSKDDNGKLSVAYDKLSIIALKAIDVLNEKNKELEERIEDLEKLMLKIVK